MQDAMKPDAVREMTQVAKKTEPVSWLVIHIALEILNSKEDYFSSHPRLALTGWNGNSENNKIYTDSEHIVTCWANPI